MHVALKHVRQSYTVLTDAAAHPPLGRIRLSSSTDHNLQNKRVYGTGSRLPFTRAH